MNKNVGLAKSINIWNGTLFAQDSETGGFPDLPDFWLNASEYISHTIDSICLGADVLILDVPFFFRNLYLTLRWLESFFREGGPRCWVRVPWGRRNIRMVSYQHSHPHVKDKTVFRPSYVLTWESPYLGKTVFILRQGPACQQYCSYSTKMVTMTSII